MSTFIDQAPRFDMDVSVVNTAPQIHGASVGIPTTSRFSSGRAAEALRAVKQVSAAIKLHRPEVVHLHSTWFWSLGRDTAVVLLCRRHRVPAVVHFHVSTQVLAAQGRTSRLFERLGALCLRNAAAAIVLSNEVAAKMRSLAPATPVRFIANPVDTDRFRPLTEKVNSSKSETVSVLFVGRVTREKGFPSLAKAILGSPGFDLVVVGSPTEGDTPDALAECAELLTALVETGRLRHHQRVELADMPRLYQEADIFCLPSRMEGMPLSLLEAMASGLPCVVTKVGGIADVFALTEGAGLIEVPQDDPAAIMSAFASLRNHLDRRRLGATAREHISAVASTTTVITTYRSLYEDILAKKTNGPDR